MNAEALARLEPRRRKRFFTPLLFRRIHKWVGLAIGLQFILWTASGTVMALLDMEEVAGRPAAAQAAPPAWPDKLAPLPAGAAFESVTLRRLLDRPVYMLRDQGGSRLLDAVSGAPLEIDAALATRIARGAYREDAPVRRATLLALPNLEAREHDGPMWRIDFADPGHSSAYIHARTGEPLEIRSDTWRVWDFAWMLHNMDYVGRTSFNHPLIIFMGFAALWVSFTGLYLLFKSFRRRDFRWLLGRSGR